MEASDVKLGVGNGSSVADCKDAYKDGLRRRYLKLFEDISYCNTRVSISPGVEAVDGVYEALRKLLRPNAATKAFLRGCCAFVTLNYKYASFEMMVKIAHYVYLALELDDLMSKANVVDGATGELKTFVEDSQLFTLKFCNPQSYERLYPGRGPLHPVCEELILYCKSDLNPFFPNQPRMHLPYLNSIFMFVEGTLLENEYVKTAFKFTPETPRLPKWLKTKAGGFEAFVICLLADPELAPGKYSSETSTSDYTFFYTKLYPMVPDLVAASHHLNDVMSFYKEMDEEDEAANFISSQAQARGITPLDVFDEVAAELVEIHKNLMVTAERSGSEKVKDAVQNYFQGSIAWYMAFRDRYRLPEVLGEDWHNADYL